MDGREGHALVPGTRADIQSYLNLLSYRYDPKTSKDSKLKSSRVRRDGPPFKV